MVPFLNDLGIAPSNPGACAGRWLGDENAAEFTSLCPATGEPIACVRACTADEYEEVIASAIEASREWRTVPAPRRGELVRKIAQALRDKKDALGSLVALETGKIKEEGDGEVQEMIDIADFSVGQSRMLYGKTMHSERAMHRMYEQWHPLGVVGVITAFSFPVAAWAWNAFIAAVAGNSVVWKPSPKAALSAIAVQRLCNRILEEAGHPAIFNLFVEEGTDLAERFIADRRLSLISFTGSSSVGRHVGEVVAKRLGRSLLELSGNNATIVDESADLDLAVPAIVFGAVGAAGQRCTSTRRLIAQEGICEPLLKRLVHAYQQVRIGDPLEPGVLMGPLIEAAAVERFRAAVAEVKSMDGTIVYGGEVLERSGYFVQPTLCRAENHWPIVQRETFAPILYVLTYGQFDEAIALHNGVPQGLSSALFTTNLRHAEQFLSAVGSDCGIANINIGTRAPKLAAPSAARRRPAAGARRVRMPGRRTCVARRPPSTGARRCRSLKAFASNWTAPNRPTSAGRPSLIEHRSFRRYDRRLRAPCEVLHRIPPAVPGHDTHRGEGVFFAG